MPLTQICWTAATSGSGKTYKRGPVFICDEFLPDPARRVHFSTFPLRVPELVAYAARKHGLDAAATAERVRVIPQDEKQAWASGDDPRGPWSFFAAEDLSGCHVAIDECHHYVPARPSKKMREKVERWQKWIGEIRHMGATIEFISQTPGKVSKTIKDEADVHLELLKMDADRDPYFNILFNDWYELRAKFITGTWLSACWEREYRLEGKSRRLKESRVFWFRQDYFKLYDSHSAPEAGGKAGKEAQKQFEIRSGPGLLWWFWRRNWLRLVVSRTTLLLAVAVFLLPPSNGGPWLMQKFMAMNVRAMNLDRPRNVKTAGFTPAAAGQPSIDAPLVDLSLHVNNAAPPPPPATQPATRPVGRPVLSEWVTAVRSNAPPRPQRASGPAPPTSQPIPPEVTAELQRLRAELEAERAAAAALEAELLRASGLVLLSKDTITLRDGYSYRVGETIIFGALQGLRVERVDFPRRVAVLDDGTVLRMGHAPDRRGVPGDAAGGAGNDGGADVPGRVRATGTGDGRARAGDADRPAADALGG